MSGEGEGNDFLSSFKKEIEENKSKGKSVIEELQSTIKEKEQVIEQKDAKIAEMEKKIKELTVLAKGAFLAPKVPGSSARTGEEIEQLQSQVKSLKEENSKLQEALEQLKKVDAQNKKLEKKIEDQKKEILELKQKKDFDLSQFNENGDDPTVNSQIRVLKTRIKNLERKIEEEKPDELREKIKELEEELAESRKSEKEKSSRIKELEAKCEILERSPPPPPPPAGIAMPGSMSAPPAPPSMPRAGPPSPPGMSHSGPPAPPGMPSLPGDKKPSFSTPPPPPPSIGAHPTTLPPSTALVPPPSVSVNPASFLGPTGAAGSSAEVTRLQRELRDLQDRYAAMSREIDEFKVTMADQTILNLKTRRIFDLQEQVKSLMKQLQENAEVKRIKQEMEEKEKAFKQQLEEKQKEIETIENEKNTLIYYYNDLKSKYEEVYKMIQERDEFINVLRDQMQQMALQIQLNQQQPPAGPRT
ncbi:MAG: hypothetical protein Q6373_005980 [Candidatus Sigynarchaeota archaeon]